MNNKEKTRKDFFKLVSCDSHTWPICGCERCWHKIMEALETLAGNSKAKGGN